MSARFALRVSVVAVTAALTSWLGPAPAGSHSAWPDYYPGTWDTQDEETILGLISLGTTTYDIDYWVSHHSIGSFTDEMIEDVRSAETTWENVPTEEHFEFAYQGELSNVDPHDCSEPSSHHYLHIDGDYREGGNQAGETHLCTVQATGEVVGFQVVYDHDEPWNFGTGLPASHQLDFRSITAHETGHATGFLGHFPAGESSTCPHQFNELTRATMCAEAIAPGTTGIRTLQIHDEHTFQDAYDNTSDAIDPWELIEDLTGVSPPVS